MPRNRRVNSVKLELIKKSREAALSAVQIFNNPNITFKAEAFTVLIIIAWTYLLHAYFRDKGIEYRFFTLKGRRRVFDKTKYGAYKHWELERCLNDTACPIDRDAINNLKFLIGLRHEIEHQMTSRIDDLLSARFQACCLNYNKYIKNLFSNDFGIDQHLSFSLQFSTISTEQKDLLKDQSNLPGNIQGYIRDFDESLSDDEYGHPNYAYRVLFVAKTANRKGQADRVIEFVKSDSPLASAINKEYTVIKETEKAKFLPKQIIDIMQGEGYSKFTMHKHTDFWKLKDAKNKKNNFGVMVGGKQWYWYESWLDEVRKHCQSKGGLYK